MKFTTDSKTLAGALAQVKSVVSNRPTLPILGNVLLEWQAGLLRIFASNLEQRMVVLLECDPRSKGAITLPYRKLLSAASHFSGEVTCEVEGMVATFTCGKLRIRLNGIAADDFPPEGFAHEGIINLPFPELKAALVKVAPFMASPDMGRRMLEGTLFEVTENALHLVSYEGHATAIVKIETTVAEAISVIVPAPAVRALAAMDAEGSALLVIKPEVFEVRTEHWRYSTAVLEGQFANWRAIEPMVKSATKQNVTFAREDALRAMDFAQVTIDDCLRLFVTAKEDISFATNGNQAGDSAALVARKNRNGQCSFVVNPGFFRSALNACESEEITVRRADDLSPLVIQDKNFTSVIGTIRVATQS